MRQAIVRGFPSHAFRVARIAGLCALALAAGTLHAIAATYYVDGNCPSSGSGLGIACGSGGPKKTLSEGVALLSSPGDTLRVRGVHNAHEGETSAFDGRYHADIVDVSGKNGSSPSSIVIEAYGYGTSPETVYIEGTHAPSSGWTRCSTCTSGVCSGVPGTCGDVWYATDSAPGRTSCAQRPDGRPTFKVGSAGALSGQYYSFNTGGYAQGSTLLVRWGSSLPAKPYVFYDNNGFGFSISSSSYVVIRGFVIRCHRRHGVTMSSSAHHITVQDNQILYDTDINGNGSGYGIGIFGANNITIKDNEIGWSDSEGIHTQPAASGATVYTIAGNWIHDNGDTSVLGPDAQGTPTGMILGDNGGGAGADYTGSVVENNLISRQKSGSSTGRGIILENNSNNWIIRNNVFDSSDGECIKLDANGISTNNNQIYNNLFLRCGQRSGASALYFNVTSSSRAASNNKVYSNTFADNAGGAVTASCSGACSGNIFRNNLMYDSGSRTLMSWSPGGTFQNNLVYSSGGTLVSFNGRSWNCSGLLPTADVDGDGTANDGVLCGNPLLASLSSNDVHLTSLSPARDRGTTVGMPAGRTASINNTVAGSHGFASYADNLPLSGTAWDIGAVEYGSVGAPTATIVLSDPSPTKAGSVGLTLSTSASVVQLPGPLVFTASDNSTRTIVLSGAVPGTTFTGTLVVDTSVPDGVGTFSLPLNSLVDASGNRGNAILNGSQTIIDQTAPNSPANLRTGS